MTLSDILIEMGAPGRGAPASLRWFADWLPDADRRVLPRGGLDRINQYQGAAQDLHAMLSAVVPLDRPRWYEVPITAQGGTEMVLGYGAVPADGGIDVGFVCHATDMRRLIGPLGPARVTPTGMTRPDGASDDAWRELRAAAGLVLRAILFERAAPSGPAGGDLLRRTAEAIYGDDWRPRLRADLGDVADRTLRRWLSGVDAVPAGVWSDLLRIAAARHATIAVILPALRKALDLATQHPGGWPDE